MVRFGRVSRLVTEKGYGFITDQNGQEIVFVSDSCEGGFLPPLHATVSFIVERHNNQKGKLVADLIRVDQYPADYVNRILSQVGEE